ncbi:MAG: hypothetical protein LBI81_03330 [Puniceicoccales bacterium]|jgi:hypothetical protein|nr:hypothetical protein [Puniceicoccales bacterium]
MKLEAYIFGRPKIYFGKIPAILNSDMRHFEENLGHGECEFCFHSSEIRKVFREYHLDTVDCEKYPAIVDFASYCVYSFMGCELPTGVRKVEDRKYEIDIENTDDINNLYADTEFKELNARYAKEADEEAERILKEAEESESENLQFENSPSENSKNKPAELEIFGDFSGGNHKPGDLDEARRTPPGSPGNLNPNVIEFTPTVRRVENRSNSTSPVSNDREK